MEQKYVEHLRSAFSNAEKDVSKVTKEILSIDGMSGKKTRHFYNNLLNMEDARYFEIGTWKGSSVCSAMQGNRAKVICVDNWTEFGGPKAEFFKNFEAARGDNDASFIESDCFKIDTSKLPKFNIYMYDGDHDAINHYRALTYYISCMDDVFIFVVDDWNLKRVRDSTMNAISDLKLKVLYEREIILTTDDNHTPLHIARESWWNGVYAAVLKK